VKKLIWTDHIKNTWNHSKAMGAVALLATAAAASLWLSDGTVMDRAAACQAPLCTQIIGPVIGAVRILKHEITK
jgi:hypothetical protein